MTKRVTRIVLEPTEDGSRFTAQVELADDTEGHIVKPGRIVAEPEGGEDPSSYRVSIDGEDVEGHAIRPKG